MNAGGVDKACKSNGPYALHKVSGERVSNTWVTYRRDRDNPEKSGLIPDGLVIDYSFTSKGFRKKPLGEWPAAYQLVGRVMAYQGYDG